MAYMKALEALSFSLKRPRALRDICNFVSLSASIKYRILFTRAKFLCYRNFSKKKLRSQGWMDDSRCYVIFNSISVVSGRWLDDSEGLCAIGPSVWLERFPSQAGLEPGTSS